MVERREMKRLNFDLLAYVEAVEDENNVRGNNGFFDRDFSGYLVAKNISASGMFMAVEDNFNVPEKLNIEMILPLEYQAFRIKDMTLTKVKGSVVRVEKNGVAVKFDDGYMISSLVQ